MYTIPIGANQYLRSRVHSGEELQSPSTFSSQSSYTDDGHLLENESTGERTDMAFDAQLQRQIMGGFATGVTVVTTRYGDGQDAGMTANAVMSLSLEPPLVVVSVDQKADMHRCLNQGQCYAINILSIDQEHVSTRFATPGPKDFRDLEVTRSVTGAPILKASLGYLDCQLKEVLAAGDHDLFVGEIVAGELGEGAPLIFYSGTYRELAP